MVTLFIFLALLYFFYAGARRGMWLQFVYSGGYVVSLLLAWLWYRPLANHLRLLVPYPSATADSQFVFFSHTVGMTLDAAFYRGVAFVSILGLGWLATRLGALWVHNLAYKDEDERLSWVVGGSLNFLFGYLFIFLLLYLLALIPTEGIQTMLGHSFLARTIIRYTPGLTRLFTALWIEIG